MRHAILQAVRESILAVTALTQPHALKFIEEAAQMISCCFQEGNKILIAGNGGSLCDAMHFAEELTGFFRPPRAALPAIALSEPGHLTCVANDLGYDAVFSRAVEALGKPGDIFIGLTTSGNSPNIIRAVEVARERGLRTILFLGKEGGKLKGKGDLELIIDGFAYSDRIQEAHMSAIHILIAQVETLLFSKPLTPEKGLVFSS